MKKEIDKSTNIIRDFNTPLSVVNRPIRQKITPEIDDQENTTNQLDLINIYGTFHPNTTTEYILYTHGAFMNKDHMLRYNSNFNLFKVM